MVPMPLQMPQHGAIGELPLLRRQMLYFEINPREGLRLLFALFKTGICAEPRRNPGSLRGRLRLQAKSEGGSPAMREQCEKKIQFLGRPLGKSIHPERFERWGSHRQLPELFSG